MYPFHKKNIGFQNNLFLEKSKDTEVQFKVKIRKHGKKKNDKDEIGNIVFKIRFYQSIGSVLRPDPPMGCANVSLKYQLNCCLSFPK